MSKDFTETAWLKELQKAATKVPERNGFLTTEEMVKATGLGMHEIRMRLNAHKRAGKLQVVKVLIETICGDMRRSPAYKIVAKP